MDVVILVTSDVREGSQRRLPKAHTHNYNNNVSCLVHKQCGGNHCSLLFCVYIVQKVGENTFLQKQRCVSED